MSKPPPFQRESLKQAVIMLWTLWRRVTLRHWRRHRLSFLLLQGILALGVAAYFSIALANRSAVASFTLFSEAVSGESDWTVWPAAGQLKEEWLREIRNATDAFPVTLVPILEATAAAPQRDDEVVFGRFSFQFLGVDFIAAANFLSARNSGNVFLGPDPPEDNLASENDFPDLLNDQTRVFISAGLGLRLGLSKGDSWEVVFSETPVQLTIAGILPEEPGLPSPADNLAVMDLPALQHLASMPGRISYVEVILPEGPMRSNRLQEARILLESVAEDRWEVVPPATRRETGETMTRAFRLNLSVLSLIALLAGLCLILQAMDGAVVRRRAEIATLRSLGLSSTTIRISWLVESTLMGLAGGALGLLVGAAAAQLTVRLVGKTVDTLYYSTTVASAQWLWSDLVSALLLGCTASVLAGWLPSREAACTPPAQLLRRERGADGLALLRNYPLGFLLAGTGLLLSFSPPIEFGAGGGKFPLGGYLAALAWILAFAIMAGALLRGLGCLAKYLRNFPLTIVLALSVLRKPTSRHRLAVAALVVAVGMTSGMLILVGSFETTVRSWIGQTLRADLFIGSEGAQSAGATNRIPAQAWQEIVRHPDVLSAQVFQANPIRIGGQPTQVGGYALVPFSEAPLPLPWLRPPSDGWNADPTVVSAFISESFQERFSVRPGQTLALPTPSGTREVVISGVFADYGNERGSVVVEKQHLVKWFGDDSATNLSITLKNPDRGDAVRDELINLYPGLRVLTQTILRSEVLRLFRQTFSITYALEILGILVAVAGLAMTLTSLLLDRGFDLRTLRSLGLDPRGIALSSAWESSFLGIAGLLGGLFLSGFLGWLLIFVINKQSFGWTLQVSIPVWPLAILSLSILACAWSVGYLAGYWAARQPMVRESSTG